MRSLWPWPKRPAPQPAPPPELSPHDAWVLNQAGLTLQQWRAMTNAQRADLRWRVGLGSK